jgi:hypothetical protein
MKKRRIEATNCRPSSVNAKLTTKNHNDTPSTPLLWSEERNMGSNAFETERK